MKKLKSLLRFIGLSMFPISWALLLVTSKCYASEVPEVKVISQPTVAADAEVFIDWAKLSQGERWSIQLVTAVLLGEARGEGNNGMTAVMNVIQNRAGGDQTEFARVVAQYKQFSCMNAYTVDQKTMDQYHKLSALEIDSLTVDEMKLTVYVDDRLNGVEKFLVKSGKYKQWANASRIVIKAYVGQLKDVTNGADHYHNTSFSPYWADSSKLTASIGRHVFYNL